MDEHVDYNDDDYVDRGNHGNEIRPSGIANFENRRFDIFGIPYSELGLVYLHYLSYWVICHLEDAKLLFLSIFTWFSLFKYFREVEGWD